MEYRIPDTWNRIPYAYNWKKTTSLEWQKSSIWKLRHKWQNKDYYEIVTFMLCICIMIVVIQTWHCFSHPGSLFWSEYTVSNAPWWSTIQCFVSYSFFSGWPVFMSEISQSEVLRVFPLQVETGDGIKHFVNTIAFI